ncbi:MAG TPA: TetR/AcrR family transcriptional regulator [Acidimicrobiia bacterium]|nr:TetR/AcrR family transcriptional regulator [Acidimicrobiia bacterium]
MAPPEAAPTAEPAEATHPELATAAAVRRAPFSDNPRVGTRGRRTQQRILDAALRAFGEHGYHRASVDRIAKLAGSSRVSFYQYFASKEDVFRRLAVQVGRQVAALTDALGPLTADEEGHAALHTWVTWYSEIHARYEPLFHAYETDEALATIASQTGAHAVSSMTTRLVSPIVPARQTEPLVRLLLQSLNHTLGVVGLLRAASPDAYGKERFDLVVADLVHRTLFGRFDNLNVHPASGPTPRVLTISPDMRAWFQPDDAQAPAERENRALTALLTAGHDVFVTRGYHNTRVEDLVSAAGVSHGAFYRYFRSKDDLAWVLTARAMRSGGAAVMEIPPLSTLDRTGGASPLRPWLRRYIAGQSNEAAMLRVWLDAALQDPTLRAESAPPLDWGRRQLARYLEPRGFGDPDMDAVYLVGLLGVFGVQPPANGEIDAAVHIIEQGLLGR